MSEERKETQAEAIRRIMGKKFYVGGQTYAHKEDLKKLGWKFEPDGKGSGRWIYEGLETDPAIKLTRNVRGLFVGECRS